MPPDADIAVVGAGIVGAATARALAQRAGSIVLLEQFELGHERGSSHGSSRIFRLNYADERFVRLARAADAAWRELEAECGEPLLERVGALDLGARALHNGRALAACGIPFETLTGEEISARWPVRTERGEQGVFQPDGGFTRADRAHAALVRSAVGAGVALRERTAVRAIGLDGSSVRLSTDRDELTVRAVVVTAGAWAAGLLGTVGLELPVVPTAETVAYVDLRGADTIPPLIDYGRLPTGHDAGTSRTGQAAYALPAPGVGLKAGLHHSGPATDPDTQATPDERLADWISSWVAERYEGAGGLLGLETCLYTSTADEQFVLERHGRVVIGSACSGHGFKFAPVVGRTLAALAREAAA